VNFYENPNFWIVILCLSIVSFVSIRLGFHLGAAAEAKHWTNEALADFKEKFFTSFCEQFEQRVETKSAELATTKLLAFIESLPEEQQQWFDNYYKKENNNDNTETGI
jgi:hypothetical protein